MKSSIVSIGCYVWLLPTAFPTNSDCLLKLYMLVKSGRTVFVSFTWKNVTTFGLLHMAS